MTSFEAKVDYAARVEEARMRYVVPAKEATARSKEATRRFFLFSLSAICSSLVLGEITAGWVLAASLVGVMIALGATLVWIEVRL